VRQLKNAIENMVVLSPATLGPETLPPEIRPRRPTSRRRHEQLVGISIEQAEKELIRNTLKLVHGNREHAAKILGIGERTLYRKIKGIWVDVNDAPCCTGDACVAPTNAIRLIKTSSAFDRLAGFNYASTGRTSLTVCAYRPAQLFGDIVDGTARRNAFGDIAVACWARDSCSRNRRRTGRVVVMPNHVHGVLWLVDDPVRATHASPRSFGGNCQCPLTSASATVTTSTASSPVANVRHGRRRRC
jgi:hypothetical protein